MKDVIVNKKLNRLANIFRETKRGPRIRFTEHGGIYGILVDTPRTYKEMYHGSGFEIGCNKPVTVCNIGGDLAVRRELESDTKESLEKLDCEVFDIHKHPEEILFQIKESDIKKHGMKESHLHFRCSNKNIMDTIKIVNFIKDY